jgi:biuret amidohydrolase
MNDRFALLIVDMQKEDLFPLANFTTAVNNTVKLLEFARQHDALIIFTRHINDLDRMPLPNGEPLNDLGEPASYTAGTYRTDVLDELHPLPSDLVIDKGRYSAFFKTRLDRELRERNITRLVVCGVMTDVCVLGTVLDGFYNNYDMTLIADACAATTSAAHYSALHIMSNWIYELEIISTDNFLRSAHGRQFISLKTETPDHLAHEVENFPQSVERIKTTYGI